MGILMKKIEECPFCGGKAVFRQKEGFCGKIDANVRTFVFRIECEGCGVHQQKEYRTELGMEMDGEIKTIKDGRQEAIDDWNRRW